MRSAALFAGALAVVVYANSLVNRFAYDDARIILDNTELHSLATLPGAVFKPYWHGSDGELELGLWRPTTTLLLGLEYAVAGENPTLYHAVNVVGHGLVSLLVVLVLAHLVALPIAFRVSPPAVGNRFDESRSFAAASTINGRLHSFIYRKQIVAVDSYPRDVVGYRPL